MIVKRLRAPVIVKRLTAPVIGAKAIAIAVLALFAVGMLVAAAVTVRRT